jgi:hypothetical protein
VSISEFLAIPAKDAVTFHVLYGNTAAELEAEIQAGGAPFTCEFYNQVRHSTHPSGVSGQGVMLQWFRIVFCTSKQQLL